MNSQYYYNEEAFERELNEIENSDEEYIPKKRMKPIGYKIASDTKHFNSNMPKRRTRPTKKKRKKK